MSYDKTLDPNAPLDAAELAFLDQVVEPGKDVQPLKPHEALVLERLIPLEMTVGRRLLSTHKALAPKPNLFHRFRAWLAFRPRTPDTTDGRRLITSCLALYGKG